MMMNKGRGLKDLDDLDLAVFNRNENMDIGDD